MKEIKKRRERDQSALGPKACFVMFTHRWWQLRWRAREGASPIQKFDYEGEYRAIIGSLENKLPHQSHQDIMRGGLGQECGGKKVRYE